MLELISSPEEKEKAFKHLDLESVMKVLQQYLVQGSVDTRVAVLKWIHHLFTQAEDEVRFRLSTKEMSVYWFIDFSDVKSCNKFVSGAVWNSIWFLGRGRRSGSHCFSGDRQFDQHQGYALIHTKCSSQISHTNLVNRSSKTGPHVSQTQYRNFLVSLLKLFEEKRSLLENRGAFIISRLCALLDAETIYRILAEIIFEETTNLKFASTMVRTLNTILLTTSELFDLRMLLKDINNEVRIYWIR